MPRTVKTRRDVLVRGRNGKRVMIPVGTTIEFSEGLSPESVLRELHKGTQSATFSGDFDFSRPIQISSINDKKLKRKMK